MIYLNEMECYISLIHTEKLYTINGSYIMKEKRFLFFSSTKFQCIVYLWYTFIYLGADVNKYSSGLTPLGVAAKSGNVSLLEALLNISETERHTDDVSSKKKSIDKVSSEGESNAKVKRKKGGDARGNNGYYVMVHDEESPRLDTDFNRLFLII